MTANVPQARPRSPRSRRQRLAAGAVLASTTLLGTYLAAVRPQPTYASPNRSDASQQPEIGPLLGRAAVSIPTCADAAPQDVVTDDTELRAAILRSQDDSVICIDGLIYLDDTLPVIDDTTLTLVGDDSTTDGINGRDLHRLVRADLTGSGDDTVYLANLRLSNGYNHYADGGGAVLVDGGGLVISGSTLSDNRAVGSPAPGGAVYAYNTNLVIEGSVFQANYSAVDSGGAAFFKNSLVAIKETTFINNEAATGAAIAAEGGALTASTVSVTDNDFNLGGSIFVMYSSLSLSNSFVGRNFAPGGSLYTGGILAVTSDLELVFTTVYDNSPGVIATDIQFIAGGNLTSIGSVVGNSTDDTPSIFGGTVDDTYSVSTGPGPGFTGSGSRNVTGGTLGLGTGALTGAGPGRPGLSPVSTSVLVTGAPSSSLNTEVNVDQLDNPRPTPGGNRWTIGARQVSGGTPPPPRPPRPPAFPPSSPTEVVAERGDGSGVVSWLPPQDPGTAPVTDYEAVAAPGGQSCSAVAPMLTCTITGLTNGATYTVTVRARNAVGWGPFSSASAPFTPEAPCSQVAIVLDEGVRTAAGRHDRIRTGGTTTCIPEGSRLTPHIRYSGTSSFIEGKATIMVQADGSFDWSRLIRKNRAVTAYVSWQDTESNRRFWAQVR